MVITGGGAGLGRVLAEMLMLGKGVRVAVLDLKGPDEVAVEWIEGRGGFMWEVCDVGDLESVRKAAERIKEEVSPFLIVLFALSDGEGRNERRCGYSYFLELSVLFSILVRLASL